MRKYKWVFIAVFCTVCFFQLNDTLQAQGVWVNGSVTKMASIRDKHPRIEVNNVEYMLMPDARVSLRYEDRPGAYLEEMISVKSIRRGQRVEMRVLGFSVYEIVAF